MCLNQNCWSINLLNRGILCKTYNIQHEKVSDLLAHSAVYSSLIELSASIEPRSCICLFSPSIFPALDWAAIASHIVANDELILYICRFRQTWRNVMHASWSQQLSLLLASYYQQMLYISEAFASWSVDYSISWDSCEVIPQMKRYALQASIVTCCVISTADVVQPNSIFIVCSSTKYNIVDVVDNHTHHWYFIIELSQV